MKRFLLPILLLFCCVLIHAQSPLDALKRASKLQESKSDSCIFISQNILTQLRDNQVQEKAYALWNIAQANLYMHKYHTALLYSLRGEELFSPTDTTRIHQRIQATTGWVFYDIGNYKQATPYHQRALEIAQARKDLVSEVLYTNALGLNALSMNQYQKALGLFQKAQFLVSRNESTYKLLSTIQNNIGIIYIAYEDWLKAEDYLLKALDNSTGGATDLIETYAMLAKVYLNTHQYNKCKEYLDGAEELSYHTSYSFSLIEYYQVRYEYEYITGNLKSAYRYQDKYIQMYKRINNHDVQEVMNYLMTIQDDKIKQDALLIEQAEKIAFNRQILIWIGGGFTFILIVVFYLMFRSKAEKAFLRQQLLSQELEKKEEQQAELSNKLAFKDEAIETLALTISKRSELVKKMGNDVEKTSSDDVKDAWKKFESAFNQYSDSAALSEGFVKDLKFRLLSNFPALTNKDIQLIIDLRNNLTSKELADKYHVEVKSIEMSRYRLRKKLQIEKGQQLKDFIMKL